jgi:hypothetical protein
MRKIEKATPAPATVAPEKPPGSGPRVAGGIRLTEADGAAVCRPLPAALEIEITMGDSAPIPTWRRSGAPEGGDDKNVSLLSPARWFAAPGRRGGCSPAIAVGRELEEDVGSEAEATSLRRAGVPATPCMPREAVEEPTLPIGGAMAPVVCVTPLSTGAAVSPTVLPALCVAVSSAVAVVPVMVFEACWSTGAAALRTV